MEHLISIFPRINFEDHREYENKFRAGVLQKFLNSTKGQDNEKETNLN